VSEERERRDVSERIPRVIGLHHAQVCVPSGAEDEARRFYCGLLGLDELAEPEALRARGGFSLQVGAAQVHV